MAMMGMKQRSFAPLVNVSLEELVPQDRCVKGRSYQRSQPTFVSIAPRFSCQDLKQALNFYGQLGFERYINLPRAVSSGD
jgi:hypothetical protein